MTDKSAVIQLVEEWLRDKDYFLVDVSISPDNKITVEIDHAEGVWIEDCVKLSRFIEAHLNRDMEDYELEVGSAGIGRPFKVLRQYENHIGKDVEVLTVNNEKLKGILLSATSDNFTIEVTQKIKTEKSKRSQLAKVEHTFTYDQVKYTKYLISFK